MTEIPPVPSHTPPSGDDDLIRWLSPHRLCALADSIFAFAMTLLVLTINFPPIALFPAGLHQFLLARVQDFFNYALSFLVLAVFWTVHHSQFHSIKRTNIVHLWINIMILLFVALTPFTTGVVGDYPGDWMTEMLFSLNLLILGSLFTVNWFYATRNRRLVDADLPLSRIRRDLQRNLVLVGVSGIALLFSLTLPTIAMYCFLAIPILLLVPALPKRQARR